MRFPVGVNGLLDPHQPIMEPETGLRDRPDQDFSGRSGVLDSTVVLKLNATELRDLGKPVPTLGKLCPSPANDPSCIQPPALDHRKRVLRMNTVEGHTIERGMARNNLTFECLANMDSKVVEARSALNRGFVDAMN